MFDDETPTRRGRGTGELARFTRDLTAEARAGRLEPIRSRSEEIARTIDILLRHGKNNPTLVGPELRIRDVAAFIRGTGGRP